MILPTVRAGGCRGHRQTRWLSALAVLVLACTPTAVRAPPESIVAVIPLSAPPTGGLAADDVGVWVPNGFDGSISRIDPLTNQVAATVRAGSAPSCSLCLSGVALHASTVWATSTSARLAMVGIDASTNRVTDSVALPVFPSAIQADADGTLWLASVLDSAVVRIDPRTRTVMARIALARTAHLVVAADAVWTTSLADDSAVATLVSIDRQSNQIASTLKVDAQPMAMAVGEGAVWILDGGRQQLLRVDPQANSIVASVPVGILPTGIVASEGSVWVISQSAPSVRGPALLRVDPVVNAVTDTVALGQGTPVGIVAGAGSLWVASRDPDIVTRINLQPGAVADPISTTLTRFAAVAIALLLVVGAWRWYLDPTGAPPARAGRQLLALRHFARRQRGDDERDPGAGR